MDFLMKEQGAFKIIFYSIFFFYGISNRSLIDEALKTIAVNLRVVLFFVLLTLFVVYFFY